MHAALSFGLLMVIACVSAAPYSTSPRALRVAIRADNDTSSSCKADALDTNTWTKLGMDDFLAKWAAANVSEATTNNVQALASSFGAPNFFCGLDNFCNAGQPCEPVTMPAWYGLLAIQNWNSYMNNVNTAITFAASILSLQLPQMVTDLWVEDPKDNVTPLVKMVRAMNTVLGLVPFTGTAKTAVSAVTSASGFLASLGVAPKVTDKFLNWADVASSVGAAVQEYQSEVSTAIKATLDAPVDTATTGILAQLAGGRFLGSSQNFTQADLQTEMIDAFKVYAAGLALQAQKMFVVRITNAPDCSSREQDEPSMLCGTGGADEGVVRYLLLKGTGGGNSEGQDSVVTNMINKYGFSKERIMVETWQCFVDNGRKQLPDVFDAAMPIDSNTKCLFMVQVCEKSANDNTGIIDACGNQGLDI